MSTMPNGETNSIPDRYRIQNTTSHIEVRNLDAYDFVKHTYDGSNGYRDGSYLIPHPREQFYETRRESSYYVNSFSPIINAMVTPVFNQDIKRITENQLYETFIDNCDNCGTELQEFVEHVITHARMYGLTFVVMDNTAEQPDTMAGAIEARSMPYVYEREPQTVKEKVIDKYGKLESITFFEKFEKVGEFSKEMYRYFDKTSYCLYYEGNSGRVVVEEGEHGLGVIPVVAVTGFANSSNLSTFPNPPTYDLAFLTFALFNKESQVVTLEQFQAFSLLVTSDFDASSLTIGPTTFLNCGSNAKFAPQYISPNTDNVRVLVENCQRLKDEIYQQAGQKGVIGVKTTSGVSKEWDFRAEEAVLKKTARVAERTENAIASLFGLYVNQEVDVEVVYPNNFSPSYDNDRIDAGIKLLKEMPPDAINTEVWKEIAQAFWAADKDKAEIIEDMLDSTVEQKEMPEPPAEDMPGAVTTEETESLNESD